MCEWKQQQRQRQRQRRRRRRRQSQTLPTLTVQQFVAVTPESKRVRAESVRKRKEERERGNTGACERARATTKCEIVQWTQLSSAVSSAVHMTQAKTLRRWQRSERPHCRYAFSCSILGICCYCCCCCCTAPLSSCLPAAIDFCPRSLNYL